MEKKNILLIIGIVLIVLAMQPSEDKKEAQADVSIAKIDRVLSQSVNTNSQFTLTYQASGYGSGSWGVLLEDVVSGGCTLAKINTGFLSPQTSLNIPMNSPSLPGTCTFTGTYVFAGSTEKPIQGSLSVEIVSAIPVCTDSLKTAALNAIVTWSIDPTSVNRLNALSLITQWATSC